MSESRPIKTVGKRLAPNTPADRLREASMIIRAAERLNPLPRPRGFVFKARTYSDYERWRRDQESPWLW